MPTTTGHVRPQLRYAELRFSVHGQDLHLTGYLDPHYAEHHHGHQHGVELFIPFRDTTSGKETYGAGRYLEVQQGILSLLALGVLIALLGVYAALMK